MEIECPTSERRKSRDEIFLDRGMSTISRSYSSLCWLIVLWDQAFKCDPRDVYISQAELGNAERSI